MTVDEVRKRVAAIARLTVEDHNDEEAHVCEDELRMDVLQAIADGKCADPAGCAREALRTEDLEFCRWYA